jgi:hypothetical protein
VKLLTIRSLKGTDLPGVMENGSAVGGLKLNGMTTEAESIYQRGWHLAIRGPILLFLSPVAKDGTRRVFTKPFAEFDLGFHLEPGESVESFQRWDSHPVQEKGQKK